MGVLSSEYQHVKLRPPPSLSTRQIRRLLITIMNKLSLENAPTHSPYWTCCSLCEVFFILCLCSTDNATTPTFILKLLLFCVASSNIFFFPVRRTVCTIQIISPQTSSPIAWVWGLVLQLQSYVTRMEVYFLGHLQCIKSDHSCPIHCSSLEDPSCRGEEETKEPLRSYTQVNSGCFRCMYGYC